MPEPSTMAGVPVKRRTDAGPSTFEQELERIHLEAQHGIIPGHRYSYLKFLASCKAQWPRPNIPPNFNPASDSLGIHVHSE